MDITNYTYILSLTVIEIMAREVLKNDSCYTFTDYEIHTKTGGEFAVSVMLKLYLTL